MGRKRFITTSKPYGEWDPEKKSHSKIVYRDERVEIDLDKPYTEVIDEGDKLRVKTSISEDEVRGEFAAFNKPGFKYKGKGYWNKEFTIDKKYIKNDTGGASYGSGKVWPESSVGGAAYAGALIGGMVGLFGLLSIPFGLQEAGADDGTVLKAALGCFLGGPISGSIIGGISGFVADAVKSSKKRKKSKKSE